MPVSYRQREREVTKRNGLLFQKKEEFEWGKRFPFCREQTLKRQNPFFDLSMHVKLTRCTQVGGFLKGSKKNKRSMNAARRAFGEV
jgi:hypothetical protein